jgi:PPM family protein phosphatase
VRLAAGAFSDAGRVRDNNEDAHVVDEQLALFAIADGMGGHVAGEIASWTAIEALRAAVANGRPVDDAITQANEAVIERSAGDPKLSGMGTTMTAVVVSDGNRLLVGHVGDSRAYFMRDGTLQQLTDDHSLVADLVREGRLTVEQAESHPQRAIVTRALGVDADVDVDLYPVDVVAGDRVIICSDGLTDMVRERDIERIARSVPDPQVTAEQLVDAANSAGGVDNITVVVLDVKEVEEDSASDAEALVVDDAAPVTPVPRSAPDVPEPVPPEPKTPLGRRIRGALLLLIPLLLIIGLAFGAVGWYARRSYYVGVENGGIVMFKGVPGGVFGWNPTLEERSDLTAAQLLPADREAVSDGAARGSKEKAEQYLGRLQAHVDSTSTTTTTTTTTTTLPLAPLPTIPVFPPPAPAPTLPPPPPAPVP